MLGRIEGVSHLRATCAEGVGSFKQPVLRRDEGDARGVGSDAVEVAVGQICARAADEGAVREVLVVEVDAPTARAFPAGGLFPDAANLSLLMA